MVKATKTLKILLEGHREIFTVKKQILKVEMNFSLTIRIEWKKQYFIQSK